MPPTNRLDEPIMALLRARGPMGPVDLSLALGFKRVGQHRAWICQAFDRLKAGGRVRCEGHGRNARWVAIDLYAAANEP